MQSSAAPKDGCYLGRAAHARGHLDVSILSRPEGRLLLLKGVNRLGNYLVSILSRPGGRLLLDWVRISAEDVRVSILSRPEGRLLPRLSVRYAPRYGSFNPQPPRRTAATAMLYPHICQHIAFQSSAAPKDGCYLAVWRGTYALHVSILSRPEGRLLPARRMPA